MKKLLLQFIAVAMFLFLGLTNVSAAILHVPANYPTIQAAVDAAAPGDEILIAPGTYPVGSLIEINKINLTITGSGTGSTFVTGDISAGANFFKVLSSGFTLQNVEMIKTDKTGVQELIYMGANNISILNNKIHGQFVIGDGDVSRAMVFTGGLSGLLIQGNEIYSLRQPGYISGTSTGSITGNYVYNTKGWVLEGGNMAFTGNTWGVNVYDIAIIPSCPSVYYTDIVAIAIANNDAVIEDQRVSPAVLSVVYVNPASTTGSLGSLYDPYQTITPAISRVVAGGKINVAAGTYTENVTIDKSLTLKGANAGSAACGSRLSESIVQGAFTIAANGITIDGFEFTGANAQIASTAGLSTWSNIIIQNNYLHATTAQIPIRHGLGLGGGIGTTNWTVNYNKIENIQCNAASAIVLFNITNVTVQGNCISHTNTAFTGRRGINCDGLQSATINNNTLDMGDVYPTGTVNTPWAIQISMSDRDATGINMSGNTIQNTFYGVVGLSMRNLTGFTGTDNTFSGVYRGFTFNSGGAVPVNSGTTMSNISLQDNNIQSSERCVFFRNLHSAATYGPIAFNNVDVNGNSMNRTTTGFAAEADAGLMINDLYINAENNYWGILTPSGVAAKVAGNVDYEPWCNADFSVCTFVTNPTLVYNATDNTYFSSLQDALNAASNGDVINVTDDVIIAGATFNGGPGTSVTINNTSGGIITIYGASPALTVSSGTVTYNDFNFTTVTNDPTILITGGTLILRGCTITESTGFTQTGIEIQGAGVLDAGQIGDHGTNTFVTDGTGKAITNNSSGSVKAVGCYWGTVVGPTIAGLITGSGTTTYDPWCNSAFTVCNYSNSTGPVTYAGKVVVSPAGAVTLPITVTNFYDVDAISLKIGYGSNLTFTGSNNRNGAFTWTYVPYASGGYVYISGISGSGVNLGAGPTLLLNLTFTSTTGTGLLQWEDGNGITCEYQNHTLQVPYWDIPTGDFYKNGFVTDMSVAFTRTYAPEKVKANVSGGASPFTYAWTGPGGFTAGTQEITLTNGYGPYDLTITDNLGAVLTGSYYYGQVHNINSFFDYATIQSAISAGTTLGGHTLVADPGTYAENVVVSKPLTIQGSGNTSTIVDPPSGPAFTYTAGGTNATTGRQVLKTLRITDAVHGILIQTPDLQYFTFDQLLIDHCTGGLSPHLSSGIYMNTINTIPADILVNNCNISYNQFGILFSDNSAVDGFVIQGGSIFENGVNGFNTGFSSSTGVTNITIDGTAFTNNGLSNLGGEGDMNFFKFNGNASLLNLTVNSDAKFGVQFRGASPLFASGTVLINNCTFNGSAQNSRGVAFIQYTDITNVSFNNVTINTNDGPAAVPPISGSTYGIYLQDMTLPTTINIGNTIFNKANLGYPHGYDICNFTGIPINATGATFNTSDNFTIEDRVMHAIDISGLGLVTWIANNNVYVTVNSYWAAGTPSIQRGIDAVGPTGWTVNVNSGLYKESNITVNKAITILGFSRTGVVLAPAAVDGNFDNSFGTPCQYAFLVGNSNVTIKNLTIDGEANTSLPAGHNFRGGVMTDHRLGIYFNNITVQDLIVQHTYRRGIQLFSNMPLRSTGHLISGNTVDDVTLGPGIVVFDGDHTINSNTVTNVPIGSGIEVVQWSAPGPINSIIQGNTCANVFTGIQTVNTSVTSIIGGPNLADRNTIQTNGAIIDGDCAVGIILRDAEDGATVQNNLITSTGADAGIWLYNEGSSGSPVNISGNSITATSSSSLLTGFATGIFMSNDGAYFETGNGSPGANVPVYALFNNNTITGFQTGVNLYANGPNAVNATISTSIITGGTTGLLVSGTGASVTGTPTITFTSQTSDYIKLVQCANNIDGTAILFDGKTGGTATLVQNFAIEDKIVHKIDYQPLGFVLVNANNAYVTDIAAASAINNDYTRIRNAVDYVSDNWTINLHGTFDWTETNAAASWALGNDGITGNDDDYTVLVPAGLEGVTFTAPIGLGDARITGPGDLASANLEGTLNFWLGDNRNWTISNMEIFDFDLAIGMFNVGSTDYNNTLITNNRIRMATDLNKIAAPADVNQNIGIHYSFGTNQTISNNTFTVPGNGVSDGANYSTMIVMQSNTSGGTLYDGLKIKNNTITVTGVPNAVSPAVIRGIWENGANSDAAIEISGNIFTNADPANTADLNRQLAFWVTSTSGAIKKVEYKNNEVSGFNEGVAWIGGLYTPYGPPLYQAGQYPVEVMNNKFDKMMNAVVVRKAVASTNPGSPAQINENSLTNFVTGGLAIKNEGTGDANSTCNWYGTNTVAGVSALVSALVDYDPWLVDGTDNNVAVGFQPVPGSCSGAANLYVNDLVTDNPTNDIYTTAIGSDANAGTPSAPFLTITKAVNTAVNGTNIWVDAGTFQEQVFIDETVDITGVDRTKTIVKAPTTLSGFTNANGTSHAIIYATDNTNTINIEKILVDGDNGRPDNTFTGVHYYDANGTFSNSRIMGIRNNPYSGMQGGTAFTANHQWDVSVDQTVSVINNIIDDYQKGGIVINELNTRGIVTGNTVTGQNIPNMNGQNGIQFGFGSYGTITGNTITNNIWNAVEHPHVWTAAGILVVGVGVGPNGIPTGNATVIGDNALINDNELNGNEVGLSIGVDNDYGYDNNANLTVYANTFNNNKAHVWAVTSADVNGLNVYDKTVLNSALNNIVFGCIQYAIDEATPAGGDIITASAGTFAENVVVHTPVSILGPKATVDGCDAARGTGEATVVPSYNDVTDGVVFNVQVNNITIKGFTIDGNNTMISGGTTVFGSDVNARAGICNGLFNTAPWPDVNHLTIENNIIRNFVSDAVYIGNAFGANHSWNYIRYNKFEKSREGVQTYALHAEISDNCISEVNRGISIHGTNTACDAGFVPAINNNDITISWAWVYPSFTRGVGIWINYRRDNAADLLVSGNIIRFPEALPSGKTGWGFYALTIDNNRKVDYTLNQVIGGGNCNIGYYTTAVASTNVKVTADIYSGITDYGVLAATNDVSWGAGDARVTLDGVNITTGTSGTGVKAYMDPAATTNAAVISVINNSHIDAGVAGVIADGATATVTVLDNTATITGNTTGVKITNSASGSVNTSTLTANGTGILVDLGGNLTSCANNFITGNTVAGVKIESTAGTIAAITNNKISGNPAGNAINNQKTTEISAECNWYGMSNNAGVTAQVTGLVDYTPWLVLGTDANTGNQGFDPQPNSCDGFPVALSQTKLNASCFEADNGSIDLTATSGVYATFGYVWTCSGGPYFTEDLTGLAPGLYSVTVTDSYGSVASLTNIEITEPPAIAVAGNVKYFNNPGTLMKDITVKLYQSGSPVYSVSTGTSGTYNFANVCPGTYEVRLSTTTVLNPIGSINSTDAAQVLYWGTVDSYTIPKVRFYAGDVFGGTAGIPNNYLNAQDAYLIQGRFVQGAAFDRTAWSFWREGESISDNPGAEFDGYLYPSVTVPVGSSGMPNINFLAMVTGDFNKSFIPYYTPLKAESENLALVYNETIQVSASSYFDMPVYTVNTVTVGAASIIFNFPEDLVEVTNVSMTYGGMLDWYVKGNELRIGWNTQNPVNLAAGEQLLTLSLRTRAEFTEGKEIRFTLAATPLNELADNYYEPIPNGLLSIGVAGSSTYGIGEQEIVENISLSNRPNPFRDYTIISYALPFDGRVVLDVYSVVGVKVTTLVNASMAEGSYSFEFRTGALEPGVYIATLNLQGNDQTLVRSIKIIRN